MALILASQSPRRKELLGLITKDFTCVPATLDEHGICAETPARLAGVLAQSKCREVSARHPGDLVIGCDTVVELNGETLGKPENAQDARRMLQSLSGRRHYVHTGVWLQEGAKSVGFVETTAVDFSEIPTDEIDRYLETEEAYDKAGGYGIQGWAARYIPRIEGCYYNVMGLPVAALDQLLKKENWLR